MKQFSTSLPPFAHVPSSVLLLRKPAQGRTPPSFGGFKDLCGSTLLLNALVHVSDFGTMGCFDWMELLLRLDAEAAVDAGSEFIITPVMLPDVIEWCKRNATLFASRMLKLH
jgi:hypothetical protein